ncbi:pyruvate, phosphate dikinase, partial [Petrachloros mirabilis]
MAKKYVYYFGDGKAEGTSNMKELLGGKGAGLAEMTNLGISVPPGFTISTEACVEYYKLGKKYSAGMWEAALQALKRVERSMGMGFGDPERPLLVSVRSGARASMPGMMDTVLNVGLTTKTVEGLAAKTRNDRFAQDSYRRFVSMFGSIVMGVPREHFEAILKHKKTEVGVAHETHLDARHLRELVASFKALVKEETKREFPDEPLDQLRMAINAVFSSWFGARAITYRRLYGIPDSWGTAVNVVAMVFGNMGETSGTGVAFTRSPSSGEHAFFGECLMNAQGEDVVAGIRITEPLSNLKSVMPILYGEFEDIAGKLEGHYRNMQDLEFTIENGKLWLLQTRDGKRTAQAEVRIAVDMVEEGLISKEEAVKRVQPEQVDFFLHPQLDEEARKATQPFAKGLNVSPGAAVGVVAFDADTAERWAKEEGKQVIMVRPETKPDDVHGMLAARGILT